jgi:hypothetical protein
MLYHHSRKWKHLLPAGANGMFESAWRPLVRLGRRGQGSRHGRQVPPPRFSAGTPRSAAGSNLPCLKIRARN